MANKNPSPATRFKKGQSGNPGGSAAGYKKLLNKAFLERLARDFHEHGDAAIEAMRENDPSGYVRVLAGLVPKEIDATVRRDVSELSDAELADVIRLATSRSEGTAEEEAGAGQASRVH